MSRNPTAVRIAVLLGISYMHAYRLMLETMQDLDESEPFSVLVHACRELKEREEREAPKVKGHRYDAGTQGDRGGCDFVIPKLSDEDQPVRCGLPESRHEYSEYESDDQ